MADEKGKLSWERLGRVAKDQSSAFSVIFDYPDREVIAPFGRPEYTDDIMMTLVDSKGSAVVVPLHEKAENIPESFAWAKESFGKVATEWDKIASGEERALLDNFRERGGILNLVQRNADTEKLYNAVDGTNNETEDARTPKTGTWGETLQMSNGTSLKENIDFIISLSTERSQTTLIHELTHAADHGISDSDLFKGCYTLDGIRGSQIVQNLLNKMQNLIATGAYSSNKINKEMVCRLNEARHAQPEQFKKECPLLDAFYSKVFYPALAAQTAATKSGERVGNQEAFQHLNDKYLLSDRIQSLSPREEQEIAQLHKALSSARDERRTDIERALRSKIDRSPSVRGLYQTMDEFQKQMKKLEYQTLQDHIKVKQKTERRTTWGAVLSPDGKKYQVPLDKKGNLVIPESLKGKTAISNHDLLKGAANGGRGQGGEAPMDKHNSLDYRDVGGKDRKPEIPEPKRPTNSWEDERRKKAEEIRRNLGWNNQVAVKRGHLF